ncbi:hypothetical protein BJ742DRAFT_809336 [Cladochytrium replicatum]|nr:hypothetical protein BJ742DRAFT_809336 [Cladochytrium replicatum]
MTQSTNDLCWSALTPDECTTFMTSCNWCSETIGCFRGDCPGSTCSTADIDAGICYQYSGPSASLCQLSRCRGSEVAGTVNCTTTSPTGITQIVCDADCLSQLESQDCSFSVLQADLVSQVTSTLRSVTSTSSTSRPTSTATRFGAGTIPAEMPSDGSYPASSPGANPDDLFSGNIMARNVFLIAIGAVVVVGVFALLIFGLMRRRRLAADLKYNEKSSRSPPQEFPIQTFTSAQSSNGPSTINVTTSPANAPGRKPDRPSSFQFINHRPPSSSSWNSFVQMFAAPGTPAPGRAATPLPLGTVPAVPSPLRHEHTPLIDAASPGPAINADRAIRPVAIGRANSHQIQTEHRRVRQAIHNPSSPLAQSAERSTAPGVTRKLTNPTIEGLRRATPTVTSQTSISESSDTVESPLTSPVEIDIRGHIPSVVSSRRVDSTSSIV